MFAPIDFVVTLATTMATDYAEQSDVLSVFLWTSGTALGVAGTTLSLVFFAGVIDRIVAVDQKGEEDLPLTVVLRGLPTARLILASILTAVLTVIGLLLFLLPGFALMVLFAVVGPVIVIEELRRLGWSRALGEPHVTARAPRLRHGHSSRRRSTSSCPPGSSTSPGTTTPGSSCRWTSARPSSSAAWSACSR